jgi:16S rRNA (guanine1207-N2)-methyltransferase
MAHYFDKNPTATSDPNALEARFHGIDFVFSSDTAVFSKKHIDFGTKLLLDMAILDIHTRCIKKGRLLDLGCGYGVIGITMKRVFPAMDVVLADINQRALVLAQENAKTNHCPYVSIEASDGWNNLTGSFDIVMTNPPVRAGKKTVFAFYDGAFEHLHAGGLLYVVLQKKQGAPSTIKHLEELFGNCEIIQKEAGYWIMRAQKGSN